jgi:DinB superfamily
MQSRDAIKISIDTADMVVNAYLADLSDADLMKRPHPQCNHLNWQIGHLIASEHAMLDSFVPGGMPPLPDGFDAKYSTEAAASDDPSKFVGKDELMSAFKAQRDGTLKALAQVSDADLSKESGVSYAPTIASLFSMQGCHWLMHCGQWVVVRRMLGKPVVI